MTRRYTDKSPYIVRMAGNKLDPEGSKQAYRITIPSHIGRLLQAKGIEWFQVSLTEEGILFKPVDDPNEQKIPTWLK